MAMAAISNVDATNGRALYRVLLLQIRIGRIVDILASRGECHGIVVFFWFNDIAGYMGLYQQERGEVAFNKIEDNNIQTSFFSSCFRLFEVEKPSWR